MTECRQLNYLRTKTDYCDYVVRLVRDGEVGGRNWSLVETEWKKDVRWHGGRFHYLLRIDMSELKAGYEAFIYKQHHVFEDVAAMAAVSVHPFGVLQFGVNNQSPGLWENGFNPNYWLEAKIAKYPDVESRLRSVVETGFDWTTGEGCGVLAEEAVEKLKPLLDAFGEAAPKGMPYHYWWGDEVQPPPRKPVY